MQDWWSNKLKTRFYSIHNLHVHLTLTSIQASYQGGNTPNDEKNGIIPFVHLAYTEYDPAKINRIWLTLMSVLNLIIEHHGGNNFRLPHIKNGILDVAGQLPLSLSITAAALEYLDGNN
jgi:hypothetical protein